MYVGLDIGTSRVKGIVVDENDATLAEESEPLEVDRPRPLWSEQSPEAWWRATTAVLDRLAAANPRLLSDVRAIGLSGQMLGVTLLDGADRPIRPALLWSDGRAATECAELERTIKDFAQRVGCRAMPGFSAPKILWLARHEPHHLRAARRVLLTKDFVRLNLTGDAVSDLADASATLLMDTRAGVWSNEIATACGIPVDVLPRLVASGEPAGTLRKTLARRWQMREDVVIAGGAGDNMCGAVGAGAVARGDACISVGTSGVYLAVNDAFVPALRHGMHTHRHALPHTFVQQGCVLSAASALDWLCNLVGEADPGALITRVEAANLMPDEVPVFTPYLAGERTPHNDPTATATFSAVRMTSGPLEFTRAVLDGVALALADCQDALLADAAPIERITLIGGGARSRFWAEIIATVIGRTLRVLPEASVGPALGAARLARLSIGGPLIAKRVDGRDETSVHPRAAWVDAYARKRERFRRHYAVRLD